MGLSSHLPIPAHVAPCWCTRIFFFSLMHPIGPELPISAHVACARVCRQLYVLRASHALVQATVDVGTVIIAYIGVAYRRGGGGGYCGCLFGLVRHPGAASAVAEARVKRWCGAVQFLEGGGGYAVVRCARPTSAPRQTGGCGSPASTRRRHCVGPWGGGGQGIT